MDSLRKAFVIRAACFLSLQRLFHFIYYFITFNFHPLHCVHGPQHGNVDKIIECSLQGDKEGTFHVKCVLYYLELGNSLQKEKYMNYRKHS